MQAYIAYLMLVQQDAKRKEAEERARRSRDDERAAHEGRPCAFQADRSYWS
jgi:hypothetical protein